MKRHLLFLFGLIISTTLLAQTPQGISHQAVMRDADNNLIVESPIGLQVSILQGAHDDDAVYVETHQVISNQNGLITYIIGNGDVVDGVFEEINWGDGMYWLETKADPTGGTAYSISGVTQFLSVPYALYAETFTGHEDMLARIEALENALGLIPYNLYLEAAPVNAGTVVGEGEYQEGAEVSITATALEGWEFVNWTGDIEYLDDVNAAEAIVTMPAQNISLTANFQEADDFEPGTVTDIDGNIYQTVIIGDQEWMAQNLRVTKYKDGTEILTDLDNTDWSDTPDGAYAIFPHGSINELDSDAEVIAAYGKLYNWYAADDARGLCPTGWSVSGDADWTQLVNYVVDQGFPNE